MKLTDTFDLYEHLENLYNPEDENMKNIELYFTLKSLQDTLTYYNREVSLVNLKKLLTKLKKEGKVFYKKGIYHLSKECLDLHIKDRMKDEIEDLKKNTKKNKKELIKINEMMRKLNSLKLRFEKSISDNDTEIEKIQLEYNI